ncbi:MAG: hypothetical protein GY822_03520 [Deltaproteobacteria bacterium]|nr:hypothetical protein [Deltaproteobacteria bacterium]
MLFSATNVDNAKIVPSRRHCLPVVTAFPSSLPSRRHCLPVVTAFPSSLPSRRHCLPTSQKRRHRDTRVRHILFQQLARLLTRNTQGAIVANVNRQKILNYQQWWPAPSTNNDVTDNQNSV